MKLTTLLITVVFSHIAVKGVSQSVTYSGTDVSLQTVFAEVTRQTGYTFSYPKNALSTGKKVTVNVKNMGLKKFLDLVFEGQPFGYKIDYRTVLVSRKRSGKEVDVREKDFVRIQVTDSLGKLLSGATVTVKNSKVSGVTDGEGMFNLNVTEGDVLLVSFIGYQSKSIIVTSSMLSSTNNLVITLRPSVAKLDEVVVRGNTGYSHIELNNPGSINVINNALINRRVSSDILSRIENLVPGVLFNKGSSPDPLLIRGRSSIYSDVTPLIVLDNFPYDGPLDNINPNDVENITILKDAAAASVWGARAGNGVIVITTKQGKTNKPEVQFNTNFTIKKRPDLFNQTIISSSDFIELEKFWFEQGLYNDDEFNNDNNWTRTPFTPVVELLLAKRKETIDPSLADQKIEELKKHDVRSDLQKYFYQNALTRQYALNVSGNTQFVNYYLSAGYDRARSEMVGTTSDRFTMRTKNTFKVSKYLQFEAGINYSFSLNNGGNNPGTGLSSGGKGLYPYAKLAGNNGEPLPLISAYRSLYVDTAGGGKLLDWSYRPLSEIDKTDALSKTRDFMINTGIRYVFSPALSLEFKYQFQNGIFTSNSLQEEASYNVRDLINSFSQIYQDGTVFSPIPKGGILDVTNNEVISHQGRVQVSYNNRFNHVHEVSSFAGWEIKDLTSKGNSYRMYGYNRKGSIVSPIVDYITDYPLYYMDGLTAKIGNSQTVGEQTDRFISFYGNVYYTYDNRITVSISGRNDAANLFGAKTNKQRGVPLWSMGTSWQINNEKFYKWDFFPLLRLRLAYGKNGNLPRTTTVTTITSGYSNSTQLVRATIINPPNENLRWEQVRIFNVGLDFSTKHDRITGSLEFFKKNSKDVLGEMLVSPTVGVGNTVMANTANMKGHGLEIMITSKNIDGAVDWSTTFLFSSAKSEVSKYLKNPSISGATYIDGGINPIAGRPVFSVYSYRWAGLDPNTGDPRGYKGKDISSDYSDLIQNTTYDSLKYSGSRQPNYFGSIMNTIQWKNISMSFNVSYKLDYFLRLGSVSYSSLFASWTGHSDYAKRWKKSGDENFTSVPSMVFPYDNARDQFYLGSEVLVKNAGQIRLEDFRLNYNLKQNGKMKFFKDMNLYVYGGLDILLWSANQDGIDPYYYGTIRPGRNIAIGLNVSF